MNLLEAMEIVIDLANENILELGQCDGEDYEAMITDRDCQIDAVTLITEYIEKFKNNVTTGDLLVVADETTYLCGHPRNPGDTICGSIYCNDDLEYS